MSTERVPPGPREAKPAVQRSTVMLAAPDAAQIARTLIEKYGADALAFARERAQRAVEVGDELALDAWRLVIEATQRGLRQIADD
jgi:hypothetical protein